MSTTVCGPVGRFLGCGQSESKVVLLDGSMLDRRLPPLANLGHPISVCPREEWPMCVAMPGVHSVMFLGANLPSPQLVPARMEVPKSGRPV